jgi:hypothetical protein
VIMGSAVNVFSGDRRAVILSDDAALPFRPTEMSIRNLPGERAAGA